MIFTETHAEGKQLRDAAQFTNRAKEKSFEPVETVIELYLFRQINGGLLDMERV